VLTGLAQLDDSGLGGRGRAARSASFIFRERVAATIGVQLGGPNELLHVAEATDRASAVPALDVTVYDFQVGENDIGAFLSQQQMVFLCPSHATKLS
jgi:hypothetical protein